MTTAAEVLAILKETFGDQRGLSALLTTFHSRRQGIYERVLEYAQSLVMLSTKVNEAKVGTASDEISGTVSSMDYTPCLCVATFNDL